VHSDVNITHPAVKIHDRNQHSVYEPVLDNQLPIRPYPGTTCCSQHWTQLEAMQCGRTIMFTESAQRLSDGFVEGLPVTSTVCSTPSGSQQETLQVRTTMLRYYHFRFLFAINLEPAFSVL
jgi:hypothetical protein